MRRVSLSEEVVDISELALYYSDFERAARNYFSPAASSYNVRFAGYTISEVRTELDLRISELDMSSSFTILSAVEGVFRIDYLLRCDKRSKDPLSRAFRELNSRKVPSKVSLEDEILELWKQHTNGAARIIGDLRGAFKYRHWLAHGRYWNPKLGKKYDFASLHNLASAVVGSLPLLGLE